MTYELEMKERDARETTEAVESKKKPLALNSNLDSDTDAEEEISYIIRKWYKRLNQSKPASKYTQGKKKQFFNNDNNDTEIICFRCKKLGPIKSNCPLNQNDKGKKKVRRAFAATWDDEEGELETDDDAEANLCLMAQEGNSDNDSESEVKDLTYKELMHMCHDLIKEVESLKAGKEKETEKSCDMCPILEKEWHALKTENDRLEKRLSH